VKKYLNENDIGIESFALPPRAIADLLGLIDAGTISGKIAKDIFPTMITTGKKAAQIVQEQGLVQISDGGAILAFIEQAIRENQVSVNDFKQGKEKALKHLMGQVMKLSKGKANPVQTEQLLRQKLSNSSQT
jgi:aspartyl-tRNA(Asn)/glutamyl-tRNA(Gln) amidotransferase subunit B